MMITDMWSQQPNPFDNIALSALVAAIPIVVLCAILLSRKLAGWIASLITLVVGVLIATVVFSMPPHLAGLSTLYGALQGLFPIGWIVLNAVLLYNISVRTGSFAIVRDTIESITVDRRLQALLIAFCFGAFLEGAAGFGAPVAITAGMLVGLGFNPLYAAGICLIANTAPVAFGGLGIAVITAGTVTDIDPNLISRMIAHQLPFIAAIIPIWLTVLISGWKGAREIWPALVVAGGSYALTMFATASYLGPMLPDILSAVVSISALVILLRFWQPPSVWRFPREKAADTTTHKKTHNHALPTIIRAWTPFVLLVIFVGNWGSVGIKALLDYTTLKLPFGALNNAVFIGDHPKEVIYSFGWLSAAGTAILLAAILTALLLRMPWGAFWETVFKTYRELQKPLITIAAVVGFAYLANYSGMSLALGNALTVSGHFFPFIAPFIGWLGVFITGSDTSSNALFGGIQKNTAQALGIDPTLVVAANTSGGVTGKMISPQSIAVATGAAGLTGQEGTLFRFTILHSLALVTLVGIITYLQAYYLPWMIPQAVAMAVDAKDAGIGTSEIILIGFSILFIIATALIALRGRLNSSNTSAL
jgi:lactate permease